MMGLEHACCPLPTSSINYVHEVHDVIFFSTLHNINDISLVLFYGSSSSKEYWAEPCDWKKLWGWAPRIRQTGGPSAEANTC